MTALALHPTPSPLEKRLLTVASGKGGVGKTWLAITLAHALALRGRKVMLFDGDLGLANVDIQLGLSPVKDLGDVLAGDTALLNAVTRFSLDSAQPVHFDILAGRSGSGSLAGLGKDAILGVRQALVQAAAQYDDVILDLGAGIDQPVAILANHSGTCLVVVTPEPTAITDAYAFIKLRRMRDPSADIRLVVNGIASRREGEQTYQTVAKACAGFLKFTPPLAGMVHRDTKVRDAIRAQTALLTRSPDCAAAQDVTALARAIRPA